MTSIPKPIPHLGLYLYASAAADIAEEYGLDEGEETALWLEMAEAIKTGKLQGRVPATGGPADKSTAYNTFHVTIQDINTWLEAEGRNYKWIPSTSIKPRTTPFRAFLQTCFRSGVDKNIESVWLYIRNNAGKDKFLFKTASNTTATTIDDKVVKKDALARTLAGLIKQANK